MTQQITIYGAITKGDDFFAGIWGHACDGHLTTDHAQSSQGLPVAVGADGRVYGPAETEYLAVTVGDNVSNAELAAIGAARAAGYAVKIFRRVPDARAVVSVDL
jgi:hypothetical protein